MKTRRLLAYSYYSFDFYFRLNPSASVHNCTIRIFNAIRSCEVRFEVSDPTSYVSDAMCSYLYVLTAVRAPLCSGFCFRVLDPRLGKAWFSISQPVSCMDTVVELVGSIKESFNRLVNRYVPQIQTIPLEQGMKFEPTWKTVPTPAPIGRPPFHRDGEKPRFSIVHDSRGFVARTEERLTELSYGKDSDLIVSYRLERCFICTLAFKVSSPWMPLLDSIYPGDRRRIAIDASYTLLRLLCTSPANKRSGPRLANSSPLDPIDSLLKFKGQFEEGPMSVRTATKDEWLLPGHRTIGFSDPMSVDERRVRKYWIDELFPPNYGGSEDATSASRPTAYSTAYAPRFVASKSEEKADVSKMLVLMPREAANSHYPRFNARLRISLKNYLRNSQWERHAIEGGASVTIHSIRRARGVRGGSVCLPVSGEAIRRSRASPDSIYTVKQALPPASTQTTT
ncbi:hypothetical protein VNO80_33076 [Phaseolus coccineus]|uniref:Uncharacterized protein n=1 Tax=Phaseolus coccineus TaxID=3886 RepID=A0AAN9L0B2_PHACN